MSRRGVFVQRALVLILLLTTVIFFSGCSNVFSSAQNTFAPDGSVAGKQRDLFIMVLWPAFAIFLLVEGMVLYIVLRFRQRKGDDSLPRQVHGNPTIEIAWTIAPALLLAIIAVPTLAGIVDLGRKPHKDALRVDVTGFQWNWQFTYPELKDSSGKALTITSTSGPPELHIPQDREIGLYLHSPDVIHSFWIPKLAGKTDVIPGRINHMWIKSDTPGDYSGQCAEFCGMGHAQMRFRVIVESQQDFDAWLQSKGVTESAPAGDAAQAAGATE
ncbi:MAG TPA: cytochrome c oxidase subunit II [Dehalococcoidia bacterium]|nr:cytochrome c oxidase subunit II [Dehalococcoidia bacterium]